MKIVSYSNEFDLSTGRSLSPPRLTMDSVLGTAEGCHIIKRDGWYYLFTAEGGTQDGHQEWVYRSDKPLGPWVAPPVHINPIVFNGNHPHIQNTGHLDMVEGENGQWWAVFLGVRPQFRADQLVNPILMRSALGRESFMAPVEWVDGWPVVNGQRPIELVGEANVGSVSYVPAANWIDEFKTTSESPLQKHGSAISQRPVFDMLTFPPTSEPRQLYNSAGTQSAPPYVPSTPSPPGPGTSPSEVPPIRSTTKNPPLLCSVNSPTLRESGRRRWISCLTSRVGLRGW